MKSECRSSFGSAAVIATAMLTLCAARLGWHYEYEVGDERFYAVEAARVIELVELELRETSSPGSPWKSVLVEPETRERDQPTTSPEATLPRWPSEESQRTQDLLAALSTKLPTHRDQHKLLTAAKYMNRDIGTFCPAWVIGTNPLTIGFREGAQVSDPYGEVRRRGLTTRPTTKPGEVEIVGRSGKPAAYDPRARDARVVKDGNLNELVDVVLVFPPDLNLPYARVRSAGATQPSRQIKVVHLRDPKPIREVMQTLTTSEGLGSDAKDVQEVPLRVL